MNDTLLALDHFEPSRQAGLARLEAFLPYAGPHYAKHRNTDGGKGSGVSVSGLSPYLRYRLLTEAEVISAVLDVHGLASAEKFIQEVVWRTYWKGWLQMRPTVWADYLSDLSAQNEALQQDGSLNDRYQQAIRGQTGIDGFDHWARQLVDTGYLHNHARMWFASIWIFTLRLPWVLGADFFLRHLLDGDPASNTLSWRWVAGIQTIGKTYLATRDNIARFTNGRFSPSGLATEVCPIQAAPPPKPVALERLPSLEEALTKPSLCLVHADDMALADEYRAHPNGRHVIWWLESPKTKARSHRFIEEAFSHACLASEEIADALAPSALRSVMAQHGAEQIVMSEPTVGSAMAHFVAQWAHELPSLVLIRRHYDQILWPAATKGFFPFKERVLAGTSLREAIE